jgi:hypothetical protein
MPRRCVTCSHPERAAIDRALAEGGAFRAIARQHHLDHDSVRRHAQGHLPRAVVEQVEQAEAVRGIDVLARLGELDGILGDAMALARTRGDVRGIVACAGRLVDALSLYSRLTADVLPIEAVRQLAAAEGLAEAEVVAAAEAIMRASRGA